MVRPRAPDLDLKRLRSHPGFKELEEIRALCARYLDDDGLSETDDELDEDDVLPEGLTRDHFKDQEMADRAAAWVKDFEAVLDHLENASKGRKGRYPKGVPRFGLNDEVVAYFKDRWERLKCRYC